MFFGNKKLILNVKRILGWVGGGVHKRIDENRELLELLRKEAPEVIAKNPWIVGWIQSNDDFFTEMESAVPLKEGRFLATTKRVGGGFPRPWPGEDRESLNRQINEAKLTEATSERWIELAYPLQQITIKLQGTRHSERETIIKQIEAIADRLRAGDAGGTEHDDDFGYSFESAESVTGPSFFEEPFASR